MRRTVLVGACVLAGGLLFACRTTERPSAGEGGGSGAPAERRFEFTYEVRIPAPAGTHRLHAWIPLPLEDPGVQEVTHLETWSSAGDPEQTVAPDFGNRMLHVAVDDPRGVVTVQWRATITRHLDAGQGSLPSRPQYLQPTRKIPLEGRARELAATLGVTDRRLDLRVRARRIYDDVLENMEYTKEVPGYGEGDFLRAVTVCKGNCTDFHARFIGVGRAAGIPVRFTMGMSLKPGSRGACGSYHCWAHWYDGTSWQPVDISEADKVARQDAARADWFFGHLDPNRISLSFGRDITLSPPQQGEKLNYFVFPYAEADGRPLRLETSTCTFTYEDI